MTSVDESSERTNVTVQTGLERPKRARSQRSKFLMILGIVMVAIGLVIGIYGLEGLDTPQICPVASFGCASTAYVPQLFSTFAGFSIILLGAAVIFLGKNVGEFRGH